MWCTPCLLQVVAQSLGIPLQSVYIAETATGEANGQAVGRPLPPIYASPVHMRHLLGLCTFVTVCPATSASADKVPNASPTAASASSDMYGAAAADACRQLKERLAPFYEKLPGKSFEVGIGRWHRLRATVVRVRGRAARQSLQDRSPSGSHAQCKRPSHALLPMHSRTLSWRLTWSGWILAHTASMPLRTSLGLAATAPSTTCATVGGAAAGGLHDSRRACMGAQGCSTALACMHACTSRCYCCSVLAQRCRCMCRALPGNSRQSINQSLLPCSVTHACVQARQ